MRSSFDVRSSTGSYAVAIAAGSLQATLAEAGERILIVDEFFAPSMVRAGRDPIALAADERTKSLDMMTELIATIRNRHATRDTTLIAIGGGVVQDAAAFAASVYMRGIPWIYVPTTLLGMADSCIGGKSSINVGKYKNIVGTYHPPESVVIDPAVIWSLSVEQRAAGLCEAAKICLCRGPGALELYLAHAPSVASNERTLTAVIDISLRAKKWFIEIDEFDRAERLLLNFGHTFGHAIEAASGFKVSHGVAVGLGMTAAFHLGASLGRDYGAELRIAAFRAHIDALLDTVGGLSEVLGRVSIEDLMDAFRSDKKHSHESFAVILINPAGAAECVMLPRNPETASKIEAAFASVLVERTQVKRDAADGALIGFSACGSRRVKF